MVFGFRGGLDNVKSAETLTGFEQESFDGIANALIFSTPQRLLISRENVSQISELIQKDFLEIHKKNKDSALDSLRDALEHLQSMEDELTSLSSNQQKLSDTLDEDDSTSPLSMDGNGEISMNYEYTGWGFTPKLAQNIARADSILATNISLNCFGNAIILGSELKEKGNKPFLCVSVDHPEVCEIEDGSIKFFNSTTSAHTQEGMLIDCEGYKIFRLHTESESTQEFFFVFDFNRAVLYEILENLEVLRRMSLGENVTNLPGTYNSGMVIAHEYAEVLQTMDWSKLQDKLFPEIVRAFKEHDVEFNAHTEAVRLKRLDYLTTRILRKSLVTAQRATSFSTVDFDIAQLALIQKSRMVQTQVASFLINDTPFDASTDTDVVSFYGALKASVVHESQELDSSQEIQQRIYKRILSKIATPEEWNENVAEQG